MNTFIIILLALIIALFTFCVLKIFIKATIFIGKSIANEDCIVNFKEELYVASICIFYIVTGIYILFKSYF